MNTIWIKLGPSDQWDSYDLLDFVADDDYDN